MISHIMFSSRQEYYWERIHGIDGGHPGSGIWCNEVTLLQSIIVQEDYDLCSSRKRCRRLTEARTEPSFIGLTCSLVPQGKGRGGRCCESKKICLENICSIIILIRNNLEDLVFLFNDTHQEMQICAAYMFLRKLEHCSAPSLQLKANWNTKLLPPISTLIFVQQ